ncbi:MAG: hypothetical protein FWH37_09345 [Candidatus Bathyarchaeota archaeon]|nr:hypothetical protein [Candidatus Termiticorpusculum sp.]
MYIQNCLVPILKIGDIVVMDNSSVYTANVVLFWNKSRSQFLVVSTNRITVLSMLSLH